MGDSTIISKIMSLDINAYPPKLDLTLGTGFWYCVILFLVLAYLIKRYYLSRLELVDMEVEVSGSPSITFKVRRDYSCLYIATRIYIELTTRKVILPFNENDTLLELYESWYKLFDLIRAEMKAIPSEQVKTNHFGLILIQMTTQILNEGLRPHLTIYHAEFSKWYQEELEKPSSEGLSPQQIQRKFPKYKELVGHIHEANKVLNCYVSELKKLIDVDERENND